jgi:hypothetical protein
VLTVAHFKPDRVFLLHSEDAAESRNPSHHLKRFFDATALVPRGGTRLELVPHDDFTGIEGSLDALQTRHQLPLSECCLNFTGGNKLMATAAFRWTARRGVPAFYLERGNRLTRFEPRDGEVLTTTEPLDGHMADRLDPVELLRCQLDASEIQQDGQTLTLNEAGPSSFQRKNSSDVSVTAPTCARCSRSAARPTAIPRKAMRSNSRPPASFSNWASRASSAAFG